MFINNFFIKKFAIFFCLFYVIRKEGNSLTYLQNRIVKESLVSFFESTLPLYKLPMLKYIESELNKIILAGTGCICANNLKYYLVTIFCPIFLIGQLELAKMTKDIVIVLLFSKAVGFQI